MLARLAILALLCVVVAARQCPSTPAESLTPSAAHAGYFPGRSGDFVIENSENAPQAQIAFLDPSAKFLNREAVPCSVPVTGVSDVMALSMGTVMPRPAEVEGLNPDFLTSDLFNRPLANVYVGVHGVEAGDFSSASKSHLKNMFAESSATLTGHSVPFSTLSSVVSAATGNTPSQHGVIGRSWKTPNGVVKAFSDAASSPQTASIADILSQSFDGRSLVLSVSADAQLTAAFCLHSSLRASNPQWNNMCISFENGQYTDAARSFAQSKADILSKMFTTGSSWLCDKATFADNRVTVAMEGGDAVFDMNDEKDFQFFSELAVISHLVSAVLPTLDAVRDGIPDLYAFTFSGISGVATKYGRTSMQFQAALMVLDHGVNDILTRLFQLYHQRVLGQVLLWGQCHHSCTLNQAEKDLVIGALSAAHLQDLVGFATAPPALRNSLIHLEDHSDLDNVCHALRQLLASNNVALRHTQAFCPALDYPFAPALLEERVRALGGFRLQSTDAPPDDNGVQRYQIVLWFSIGFALLLLAAIYSLCYMDLKRDTLLYSKFNPHWKRHV